MGRRVDKDSTKHEKSLLAELFKKRSAGRCLHCLASDHIAIALPCFRTPPSNTTDSATAPRKSALNLAAHRPPSTQLTAMSNLRITPSTHPRPGSPSKRVDRVKACAAYTPDMAVTENDYQSPGSHRHLGLAAH
jgi:hypothetical protein